MAEFYRHTQKGTLIRRILGGLFIGLLVAPGWMIHIGQPGKAIAVAMSAPVVTALCLLLFHSLTVSVSPHEVRLFFGIGLIRKSFPIDKIQTCERVRTTWINGWGIHKITGGWLYNVSGFDAVELQTEDGAVNRIGTDQADRLVAAIREASEKSRQANIDTL